MAAELVEKGDVIALKALLENSCDYDGEPYQVTAARKTLPLESLNILIPAGEDVRATLRWEETPLHLAPDERIARLLISHGADVHAVDIDG
jgi:hypothetical protein